MKTNASVLIPAKREDLWSALIDLPLRSRWQVGVREVVTVSGTAGERGHVARVSFDDGRPVELETTTEARRPDLIALVIESDRYRRTVVHNLESADDGNTRWQAWSNTSAGTWAQIRSLFGGSGVNDSLASDMERLKLLVQTKNANEAP